MHSRHSYCLILVALLLASPAGRAETPPPPSATASSATYNAAAVCDFVYARLFDAEGRIAHQAPNRPPVYLLPTADGSKLYQFKNDDVSIDFRLVGEEKKIVTARFFSNGLMETDRYQANLLSRLGVRHPNMKQFHAGCDAANLAITFSNNKLLEAKVFFDSE